MKISKETRIGISSIIILLVAYWGITFLKGENILSNTNVYQTSYQNVIGLEMSSPILINGMKVGTVIKVGMSDVKGDVIVDFTVKSKYKIPNNSVALLEDQSIMGGKAISIKIGDSDKLLADGSIIKSDLAPAVMDAVNVIAEKATMLLDSLSLTISKINSLMSPKMIADAQSTVSNMNSATATIDQVLSSEKVKIAAITKNLKTLTEDLNTVMPDVKGTMSNINNLTDSLNNSLPKLLAEINEIVAKMNESNGTIGKFINDGKLYDSANITLEEAAALLKDLKENPKKYVHFSLFGKKDKNEKK